MVAAQDYIRARTIEEDRGYVTPCWVWRQYLSDKGYGLAGIVVLGERRAHRIAYRAFVATIPFGYTIDHLCGVKSCCNPEHLEPVTSLENFQRYAGKQGYRVGHSVGRTKPTMFPGCGKGRYPRPVRTHCGHGHELTPDNVLLAADGYPRCLQCRRDVDRKRREKRRLARIASSGEGQVLPAASHVNHLGHQFTPCLSAGSETLS